MSSASVPTTPGSWRSGPGTATAADQLPAGRTQIFAVPSTSAYSANPSPTATNRPSRNPPRPATRSAGKADDCHRHGAAGAAVGSGPAVDGGLIGRATTEVVVVEAGTARTAAPAVTAAVVST